MKKVRHLFLAIFLPFIFLFCFSSGSVMSTNIFNIIPYPNQLIPDSGYFNPDNRTLLVFPADNPEISKLALQFSAQIRTVSGIKLVTSQKLYPKNQKRIEFVQTGSAFTTDEAYRLKITPELIRIEAKSGNGFFYALQTIYQLLPPQVYGNKKVSGLKWKVPAAEIADSPRFAYRGLHLDVCRHFFPIEFIKKYIDAMAIHKLNIFHWHLTDDQGWRIEIKKYPRLTEIGSKRDETLIDYYYKDFPQQFDGKPYGGFYTQAEAREIVAYAKARYITVIPEIELPGHALAALASYTYLSCNQDSTYKVATKWGIFKDVYCPRDSTFNFLEDVLTEVMAVFPSNYIHIGGDECPKDSWKNSAECQALIKNLKLKDENELQSYFVERIEKFINSKGRRIIGWDEILEGGLAPNATVMSWRGINGGIAAAKSGHNVIMTPGAYCYFDKFQADPGNEPVTIGGYLPLKNVYQFEPVPTELSAEEANYIVGAQANVWTEYMPTSQRVEYMAFPRVAAMAEVLWSNKENKDWERFRGNMITEFDRYKAINIQPCKAFFEVQIQPVINAEGKMQVELRCDDPEAQIHYSLNSNAPTFNDSTYTKPVLLSASTTISAAAFVKGKSVGRLLSKFVQVSKLTGLPYTQNITNTWYTGVNKYALTDGILGNTNDDIRWVGIGSGSDAIINIDMKTSQPIERFSVGLLSAPAFCVLLPPEIKLFGSVDGADYQLLSQTQLTPAVTGTWTISRPELTFPTTNVRFLRLEVKNAGICPADHLNGGVGSKLFLDEIGAW